MSDDRWLEIDRDIQSATLHFAAAVRLGAENALRHDDWDGYKARMSLVHAMQAGHTSFKRLSGGSLTCAANKGPRKSPGKWT